MRGGRIPYFLRRRALLIPRRGRGQTQFCGQRPQLLSKALPSAEYFAPRARPNSILRPKAALLSKVLPSAKHSAPRARPNSILRPKAALLSKALPSAEYSAPRARPNSILRPKAALLSSPWGSAPSPPFSFCRKKRTGRWSGPREKRQGGRGRVPQRKAGWSPWTPTLLGEGASCELSGVSGRISASGRTTSCLAPTIFLWYRQAAPSLFLKKRWWGRKHPSLRG